MKLTGEAKKHFDKWHLESHDKSFEYNLFDDMPDSMQWGVYVDFFDSVNIHIQSGTCEGCGEMKEFHYWCDIKNSQDCHIANEPMQYKSRAKALKAGIEKANEIYNIK